MARLFLACPVPADGADQLYAWAQENLEGRKVPPENLHVTLVFFGEVEDGAAEEMASMTNAIEIGRAHV